MSEAATREQHLLQLSLGLALVLAVATIGFGLTVGSKSILFDGIYTVVEAAMTGISLVTARLISRGDDQLFQYGYWHLEPLVVLINALILALACLYGFIDGVNGLLTGGRALDFRGATAFYAIVGTLNLLFFLYLRRGSRKLGSHLLDLDARSWLIGAVLAAALGAGFLIGTLIEGTRAAPFSSYVDPAILTLVSLGLLPLPLGTIVSVGREILQMAPEDLDEQVHQVAEEVATRHGFRAFNTHVRRAGRQRFVEIGFVARSSDALIAYGELDRIRGTIADALGGANPGCWLTVDFTAEERWI